MGRLPEAWLAPPQVRELRELVRSRAKLVALRSGLKAQVHPMLAKEAVRVPMSDLFGMGGTRLLDQLQLGRAYGLRVASLRGLITAYDQEIAMLGREIAAGWPATSATWHSRPPRGVGPVLAAVLVAEIGDIHRFAGAPQLCSWAGLTPRHRESDTTVRRGPITKQGPRAGALGCRRGHPAAAQWQQQATWFHRIADRRGTGIGRVAAARKLLTLVFYGLRDGQVRCLAPREAM